MELGIYMMLVLVWIRLGGIKDTLKQIAEEMRGAK